MCMEKHVLVKKMFTWVYHDEPELKRLSPQEKVWSFSNKKADADSLLRHETTHDAIVNSVLVAEFTLFIEWPSNL